MPAPRKPLEIAFENKSWVVRFRHPLTMRVVRFNFGHDQNIAGTKCRALNDVFLNAAKWHLPDFGEHEDLRRLWTGAAAGVHIKNKRVVVNGQEVNLDSPDEKAGLLAIIETLQRDYATVLAENRKLRKQLEAVMGRKVRSGPCPSLQDALDKWKKGYVGRDPDHTKIVFYDLQRFVDHFEKSTPVDDMDGREKSIDTWLRGIKTKEVEDANGKIIKAAKPISAGRRAQVRRHVLRFLTDEGLMLNRGRSGPLPTPTRLMVRTDRGPIRWLTKDEAKSLADKLEGDWKDAFELQCAIGLRPSEIPTLKCSDISGECGLLELSPLGELTLKTGGRKITLSRYPVAQKILKRRAEKHEVLFNHDGKPWKLSWWNRQYCAQLQDAAKTAGIGMRIDGRVGRRTCASLLIRDGKSIEAVSKLLGDDPKTIREHYGDLTSEEA